MSYLVHQVNMNNIFSINAIGYISVKDAVREFENHFKKDVTLPKIKPAILFTNQFGRFYEDREYNINDLLKIKFVNEKAVENNYKIDIRPLKNKIIFKDRENQKAYTLKNGEKAIYFEHQLFNFLVFENNNWQYMFGIDKRLSKVTPGLVEIANSIE
ncbi:carbon monoxide dehydrogenase [Psychrobacillus glaciei]|uniref:carbon monoxide dehydrogenase n=1 Tax=Psychrobacillus glaciei TaxID=2283160 RepID=UPI001CEFB07B|nr:carbon monoxide dehydrogenase [Psychrobacillus glaciei]